MKTPLQAVVCVICDCLTDLSTDEQLRALNATHVTLGLKDELAERRLLKTQGRHASPPKGSRWTMRELAHAAWKKADTGISASTSAFEAWCSTRVKASTHPGWGCPPLILAIAAWNGAHDRDSLASFPPEESAIFEPWFAEILAEGHAL